MMQIIWLVNVKPVSIIIFSVIDIMKTHSFMCIDEQTTYCWTLSNDGDKLRMNRIYLTTNQIEVCQCHDLLKLLVILLNFFVWTSFYILIVVTASLFCFLKHISLWTLKCLFYFFIHLFFLDNTITLSKI